MARDKTQRANVSPRTFEQCRRDRERACLKSIREWTDQHAIVWRWNRPPVQPSPDEAWGQS
eukprot:1132217-Lingulodinium_polyedra.AAC.1